MKTSLPLIRCYPPKLPFFIEKEASTTRILSKHLHFTHISSAKASRYVDANNRKSCRLLTAIRTFADRHTHICRPPYTRLAVGKRQCGGVFAPLYGNVGTAYQQHLHNRAITLKNGHVCIATTKREANKMSRFTFYNSYIVIHLHTLMPRNRNKTYVSLA